MACGEGLEAGLFLRSLFLSMSKGRLVGEEEAAGHIDLHLLTDCKSLYDHLRREGTPKAPSDKRLAVDLASLRQLLVREGHSQWQKVYGLD